MATAMTATVNKAPIGGHQNEDLTTFEEVTQRYLKERQKRLREEGDAQYIDVSLFDEYRHFQDDPWVAPAAVKDIKTQFPDSRCEMLIIGAGLAGLLYAVRMIEAGVRPQDIRIIDRAGGFGGTWYWNRHPGLTCDVESYCYLPLLEETGNGEYQSLQSYPVDMVIFATGYRNPLAGSVADKAKASITGRNGISMSDEWAENGPKTLHGVIDYNFPNMFQSGPLQASNGGVYVSMLDALSTHSAYIFQQAKRKAGGKPFAMAPTAEAAENWGTQIEMRAFSFAAAFGCTPSFFNLESGIEHIPAEKQAVKARSGVWGAGFEDFSKKLETWRADDNIRDIDVWI
ncbi:hypothetical protein Plec18170_006557 [Paecilomyces lecythidis]